MYQKIKLQPFCFSFSGFRCCYCEHINTPKKQRPLAPQDGVGGIQPVGTRSASAIPAAPDRRSSDSIALPYQPNNSFSTSSINSRVSGLVPTTSVSSAPLEEEEEDDEEPNPDAPDSEPEDEPGDRPPPPPTDIERLISTTSSNESPLPSSQAATFANAPRHADVLPDIDDDEEEDIDEADDVVGEPRRDAAESGDVDAVSGGDVPGAFADGDPLQEGVRETALC